MTATRALIPDVRALKVYRGACGNIWFAAGEQAPRVFDGDVPAFAKSRVLQQFACTRVLGLLSQAELICHLHAQTVPVQVATPSVATPSARDTGTAPDPAHVLRSMRALPPGFAASLGGWHHVREIELPPYRMCVQLLTGDMDAAIRTLRTFAPSKLWAFCTGLDECALAQLVTVIRDPRFYVSQLRPESSGRLRCYLGLTPRTSVRICDGTTAANTREATVRWRYNLVRDTVLSRFTPDFTPSPRAFAWQQYAATDHRLRELRTLQRFVTFLRYTWLQAIYADQHKHSEPLFEPKYFFRTPEEVQCFSDFLSNCA